MWDLCKDDIFELNSHVQYELQQRPVEWGYGDLSWATYKRTYAQELEDGKLEEWPDTVIRVINGMFTIQKVHCRWNNLPWNERKAQRHAARAARLMFDFKWLPPGRGLEHMGTSYMWDKGQAILLNCAFASTKDIDKDYAEPFTWAMDFSMLGVGVGYDTRGKGKVTIKNPRYWGTEFTVEDSREGWIRAVAVVLKSFVDPGGHNCLPTNGFNYSKIRPKGSPLNSFRGKASGPEPLKQAIDSLIALYTSYIGKKVDSRLIVDTFNIIGKCVVSGGIRRTALLSLGDPDDEQFVTLKQDREKLMAYRWASNNSVIATSGQDYSNIAPYTADNGEPGYLWLENVNKYARMGDVDFRDQAIGTNPCQPGFATVYTHYGVKTFDEIGVDDVIWSGERWTSITTKVFTGIKPVYAYKTNAGVFYGTEDHRVVENGIKIPVKDAKSIDVCLVPGQTGVKGETVTSLIIEREPLGDHPVYDIMVADEAHTYWTGGLLVSNCGEQPLYDGECCTLVETFPAKCDSYDEYTSALKAAYLYAKSVTLFPTHCAKTNSVMMKNRRIGCSQSGIVQSIHRHGYRTHFDWCDAAYYFLTDLDDKYSDWLGIPRSIRKTTTKPSGTVSLVAGSTPGIHYDHSEYYIRRVRISDTNEALLDSLRCAGYPVERDAYAPSTYVVSFPVHVPNMPRGKADVSLHEQVDLAAQMAKHWADNMVSCTATFKKEEAPQIKPLLEAYEDRLKSISFLPLAEEDHKYVQPPYETITKEKYEEMMSSITPISSSLVSVVHDQSDKFCDGEACSVEL